MTDQTPITEPTTPDTDQSPEETVEVEDSRIRRANAQAARYRVERNEARQRVLATRI